MVSTSLKNQLPISYIVLAQIKNLLKKQDLTLSVNCGYVGGAVDRAVFSEVRRGVV